MSLPIRTFWFMNTCINRLQAERDMRALTVASNAHSGEAVATVRQSLTVELGDVMKLDPIKSATRDEEGFQRLKAMTKW